MAVLTFLSSALDTLVKSFKLILLIFISAIVTKYFLAISNNYSFLSLIVSIFIYMYISTMLVHVSWMNVSNVNVSWKDYIISPFKKIYITIIFLFMFFLYSQFINLLQVLANINFSQYFIYIYYLIYFFVAIPYFLFFMKHAEDKSIKKFLKKITVRHLFNWIQVFAVLIILLYLTNIVILNLWQNALNAVSIMGRLSFVLLAELLRAIAAVYILATAVACVAELDRR